MAVTLQEQLQGAWHLVAWKVRWAEGEEFTFPFGEQARGMIMYSDNGFMSAVIHRGERTELPAGLGPRQMPAEVCAEAYQSYMHYAGPYRMQGDSVIHRVEHALNPNMVGSEQLRHIDIDGDCLTLRGEEALGERQRLHEVDWQRR
jgi:hypothetical protein